LIKATPSSEATPSSLNYPDYLSIIYRDRSHFVGVKMPRIARGLSDGLIYQVINRGNGKQQVFHKEGDYRAFLDLMQEGKES
jgi:hypothetical protein